MDVVAFIRDRRKFEKVLYEEEDLVLDNLMSNNANGKKRTGPRLEVVISDVVSQRDVFETSFETNNETKILDYWVNSAKIYFDRKGWTYDNTTSSDVLNSYDNDDKVAHDIDKLESGGEEAIRDAITGATIIISCLASHRFSRLWTDFIRVPLLRVFRKDASKWCPDSHHPYYVNYLTTKKILDEAEKEQRRRDVVLQFENERLLLEEQLRKEREKMMLRAGKEEEGFESTIAAGLKKQRSVAGQEQGSNINVENAVRMPTSGQPTSINDRIKFIRVGNLMVRRNSFSPLTLLTNTFWSQLSRYEYMAENLMEKSVVDTIILRPGDLTDAERNINHTSLQLCVDGKVPSPSLVGREDVADIAVVAALSKTSGNNTTTDGVSMERSPAHHYNWALRWTGQHLSPPQGLRPDGLSTAALCFVKAMKQQKKLDKDRRLAKYRIESYYGGKGFLRLKRWRNRLKPWTQSLAVSTLVYTTISIALWYTLGSVVIDLLSLLKRRVIVPQAFLKMFI